MSCETTKRRGIACWARRSPLFVLSLALPSLALAEPLTVPSRALSGEPGFPAEACAAMAIPGSLKPADVFDACALDPTLGRGARLPELDLGLKKLGIKAELRRAPGADAAWPLILTALEAGRAVVLEEPRPRLIVGYEAASDQLSYRDPSRSEGARLSAKRAAFFKDWGSRSGAWLAIQAGKARIPALEDAPRFRPYAFARRCRALRRTLPRGFTLVIEKPFIVAGDEAAAAVRRRAAGTVRWVTRHLKKSFFSRDPERILTVWLFRDASSYKRNAEALFGDRPDTPYGYYSSRNGALVMNIATGGGTLCHEVVHPFIEANFPSCPAWLNEGLGSLYEACRENNGRLVGTLNWRLSGLQAAIKEKRRPSIAAMVATSADEFYGARSGVHYAQARYLCYYLQEIGELRAFYKRFLKNRAADPTGADSLKAAVGDLAAFDKRFEAWAAKLKRP